MALTTLQMNVLLVLLQAPMDYLRELLKSWNA